MTTLRSKLPSGDRDGLSEYGPVFVNEPERQHVLLLVVDVAKVVRNVDTDESEPVLRIRRAEVVSTKHEDAARDLLVKSVQARLGEESLPISLVNDIDGVFDIFGAMERDVESDSESSDIDPDDS